MSSLRVFFIIIATLILVGIGLTGFRTVHWFLYLVPGVLIIAASIGFCPLLFLLKLVGFKGQGGRLK